MPTSAVWYALGLPLVLPGMWTAGFQQEMDFSDRPMLDKVKTKLQQVHDDLLVGLMEGKKK